MKDRKWIKQVEDWTENQGEDNLLARIRRTAVIWGVYHLAALLSYCARVGRGLLHGAMTCAMCAS